MPIFPDTKKAIRITLGLWVLTAIIYTYGSGLDPHITLSAAQAQLDRIACSGN